MNTQKEVTREEAQQLLEDVGHQANVSIPFAEKQTGDIIQKTVLNNAMVYNPFAGKQYGGSNNKANAENAMKFIKNEFSVYSSYFSWATGDYKIIE